MRTLTLIAIASILNVGLALAGSRMAGPAVVQHIFSYADTDRSGALTADEYVQAGLPAYGIRFEEVDANRNGRVSIAEYVAIYQRHHPGERETNL